MLPDSPAGVPHATPESALTFQVFRSATVDNSTDWTHNVTASIAHIRSVAQPL
jgi:hypothetical protein